jgi:hypothetical protein
MGTLISEVGRESNLKLVAPSEGLSGLILREQETNRSNVDIKMMNPPFMVII